MLKDPTGQMWIDLDDDYGLFKDGRVALLRGMTGDPFDRLIVMDDNGRETSKEMKVFDRTILPELAKERKGWGKTRYAVSDSPETGDVFLFTSQHSDVEWGLTGFRNKGKNEYYVYTDRDPEKVYQAELWGINRDKEFIFGIHSHPGGNEFRKASGYNDGIRYSTDMSSISLLYARMGKVPEKYIYHPSSTSLINYDPWNPQKKITPNVTYPGGLLFLYKK